jgi:putative RNA 2'-phosphotransferase
VVRPSVDQVRTPPSEECSGASAETGRVRGQKAGEVPHGRSAGSRRLSYVLRHAPESIGLTLDVAGWAEVEELLQGLADAGVPLSRAELERLVASSDKQRFALNASGTRIRASQGHSVPVDLGLEEAAPPQELFHGTVERFLPAIRVGGLTRQARHHVHLSPDVRTARSVGARRGVPRVLLVAAQRMVAEGHRFYLSANGVWLTEGVPYRYLTELPD